MNTLIFKKSPELTMLILCIVVAVGFFTITNPRHVAPVVLIVGFLLLFGVLYFAVRLATKAFGLHARLPAARYQGIVGSLAALPVVLLALQSIGQLTIRDVITLAILCGVGYFYVSRASRR